MRTVRIAVLVIAGLAGLTGLAAADAPGIHGRVTSASLGTPLEGANVLVVAGQQYLASATTDADGRYFIAVRPGTYDVVLVSGASRLSSRVTVVDGERATADGRLGTAPPGAPHAQPNVRSSRS